MGVTIVSPVVAEAMVGATTMEGVVAPVTITSQTGGIEDDLIKTD